MPTSPKGMATGPKGEKRPAGVNARAVMIARIATGARANGLPFPLPMRSRYVRGETHTNTLGGHWSQFKRSIRGKNIHVSAKHLWKYVAEFSYRRNLRHSHEAMFDRLVASFSQPRVAET